MVVTEFFDDFESFVAIRWQGLAAPISKPPVMTAPPYLRTAAAYAAWYCFNPENMKLAVRS